jgi:hypothetical protein
MAKKGRSHGIGKEPTIPEEWAFPGTVNKRNIHNPVAIEDNAPTHTQTPASSDGRHYDDTAVGTLKSGRLKYAPGFEDYL